MNYEHIVFAKFLSRPNRFIAYADIQGKVVTCHVKNTGRCKELLLPGCDIILEHHPNAALTGRKTEYSLIQVYKQTTHGKELINMDSQAPNQAAFQWLNESGLTGITELRREVAYGGSRLDLSFRQNGLPSLMEVKGVTLEADGIASFPDAPTLRGVKHLAELEHAVSDGYQAYVLFVIAMKGIRSFQPNIAIHPGFGQALTHAAAHGVRILAYDCIARPDSLRIDKPVAVNLT